MYIINFLLCFAGAIAVARSRYGAGTGPIALDNIECIGTENMLHLCPHGGLGIHDCSEREHASVVCQRKSGLAQVCIGRPMKTMNPSPCVTVTPICFALRKQRPQLQVSTIEAWPVSKLEICVHRTCMMNVFQFGLHIHTCSSIGVAVLKCLFWHVMHSGVDWHIRENT